VIELDRTQHEALTCEAKQVLLTGPRGTGKTSVIAERAIWLILECDVAPEAIAIVVASPQDEHAMREIAEKPLQKMQYRTFPAIMTAAAFKSAAQNSFAHVLLDDLQDIDDVTRNAVSACSVSGATVFAALRTPGESASTEAERASTEKAQASFAAAAHFELVWIYRTHDAKKKRGPSAGEEQMSLF